MKRKLFYLAPQNPYPPIDGGKIGIYYSLIHLAKYFDIIFTFPYSSENVNVDKVKKHFAEKGIKIISFVYYAKNDFRYLIKNLFKEVPFKWDKYYSKTLQEIINKIIEKENIKILLVSHPHMAKYAIKAKKIFPDIKIYLREHNIEFKLVEQFRNYTSNFIYKLIANWQLRKTKKIEIKYWHLFDKIFFISDLDYNIAKELSPDISYKFEVLYDGYNIKTDKPLKYTENSFIYTANLKTVQNNISFKWFIKNIWIPSLGYIKKKNIKLYITGNTKEIVYKIIGKENIDELNIINLDFVENIDREILKHKYVLSPTIIGSGLRLKILNGMACGKPVFLTPLDISTCKVFKDLENVVLFSNNKSFIEKLRFLEENEKLYYKICYNALNTIEKYFNWEKYALKIYNTINIRRKS